MTQATRTDDGLATAAELAVRWRMSAKHVYELPLRKIKIGRRVRFRWRDVFAYEERDDDPQRRRRRRRTA